MRRIFLLFMALAILLPVVTGLHATEVTIGTGDQNARYPVDFYWKNSLYQCLYFQDELGFNSGTITQLTFYNNFNSANIGEKPVKIWLGSTQQSDLSDGYIPATQLTLVYDGDMSFPQGENTITFDLHTPYMHTPGNLVLMAHRHMDGQYYSSQDYFKCQTEGSNRARYLRSDSTTYDPNNPTGGTLTGQFPKITITYTDQPINNDLGAVAISGNLTPNQNSPTQYMVTIRNNGINAQSDYQVKLKDSDGTELVSVAGPAIASQETMEIALMWTPTQVGSFGIYGEVALNGDEIAANNQTSTLTVDVQEPGAIILTIGTGSGTNTATGVPTPYGTRYKNFRQQYLYTGQELLDAGAVPGPISSLSFNVQNLNNCLPMSNFKIRIKDTTLNALTTSFETGDYTQVFFQESFMPELGWNVHIFDAPYIWDGTSNILVDIVTTLIPEAYTQNASVYYTPTSGTYTCLRYQSNTTDAETSTSNGTRSYNRANVRIGQNVSNMGTLQGVVTCGTEPLDAALVVVNDTIFNTITTPLGEYAFPYIDAGTHTVTASKVGYETQTATVTIVAGETTTLNFNLPQSVTVTVSGHVVGSDVPTQGLEGAEVTLQGPLTYSGVTDAQGNFSITGVLSGNEYFYSIMLEGYDPLYGTVFVGSADHNMGTLIIPEATNPPRGVTAQVSDDNTQVNLIWISPGSAGGIGVVEDFEFDDGGWESSGYGDWEWTNEYDVSQYVDIDNYQDQPPQTAHSGTGMWGTKIHSGYSNAGAWSYLRKTFNLSGIGQPVLSFWHYMDGYNTWDYGFIKVNGEHVWGAENAAVFMPWQELTIDLSQWANNPEVEISFEWYATTTVSYAGWYIDDVYVGQSLGRHTHFANHAPTKAIRSGLSEEAEADLRALRAPTYSYERPAERTNNRVHLGYKAWRLLAGEEQNEDSWTLLTTNTITDTTLVDPAWGTLPDGNYRWAVKAAYTNEVYSVASFSNTLRILRNDLAATSISGNFAPTQGTETIYTVVVENVGTDPQTGTAYTVKLMQEVADGDDVELASLPGVDLAPGATQGFNIAWTPVATGPMGIYGKVILPTDSVADNDVTDIFNISVLPTGTQSVTIGTGDQNARWPIDFYYKNSLYECIYLADELEFVSGTISGITFYSNFSVSPTNGATKIYMGTTDQTDLNDGWIPANELTLVYDGDVNYPVGEGNVNIAFQTPYQHTPGNLVMMVHRPMDTQHYGSSNYFRCQTIGSNRARYLRSDSTTYDPNAPTTGTRTGQFPMATILYIPADIENDLGALSISGNRSPTVGVASVYTVRIKNNGSATQENYTVKLMGPNDEELVSMAGPTITSQQILEVEVPWTPTAAGPFSIYGKVEMAGDTFEVNNTTRPLNLMVNPAGVFTVMVGDGSMEMRMPMDFFYKNSLYETLYYPDDLGGFIGQITGIRFNTNFTNTLQGKACKMWIGTTTVNSLADGWIPATQLTQVYDGLLDFNSGAGESVTVIFDEPFMYLDGGNLVLMVNRPMDTQYHSSSDRFLGQGGVADRARNVYSDSTTYDPNDPTGGTLTPNFPQTTFLVIPGGVGHISGTVTDANNQPISGVAVSLNNGAYNATTDTSGQYQLINVLPDTYTMSFNAHGYYEHTQTVVLAEDDELTINATLQLLPQVNVTGTILASDTGAGISGALIQLSGYEPYTANTNAAGAFTIPNVFADHTYDYNISAAGYTSENGQIIVGTTNYDMGQITLNEVAYAPMGVEAEVNDGNDAVNLTWLAPDPTALEVVESFEADTFPPEGWTQTITNTGPANALGIYPTWCRNGTLTISGDVITPTDGSFQAGLHWDYNHQDEWLITPAFNCPPNAHLSFDGYVFLGSEYGDHYYVKLSTDNGATWNILWDASTQTGGWNEYSSPITVDLSAYSGNQVMIAFHAEDPTDNSGLRYYWFIDNVYIGDSSNPVQLSLGDMTTISAASAQRQVGGIMPLRARSRDMEEGTVGREPRLPRPSEMPPARKSTRVLVGYMVYRLQPNQENLEDEWVAVTDEPTAELNFSDTGWADLENGDYRWAVKAVYTNNVTSVASFSNILNKFTQTGMIVGTVRQKNNTPIVGASVTNGTVSATTNSMGAYTLVVPIGYHSVTASAAGYDSLTVDDVLVNYNLATTVNFVLQETSNADDHLPVVATALNGNYPNPFNPETTISYSVKEAGRVKLEVYNIKGQLVRTLVDEEQTTGHYKLVFDAKDDRGRSIASGVYMLRMAAPGYRKTSKMILMQ